MEPLPRLGGYVLDLFYLSQICLPRNCTIKQIFLVLSIMHLAHGRHSLELGEREIEGNEHQLWRQAQCQVQLHEAGVLVSYFEDREIEVQKA